MLSALRKRMSYANVVATLALVFAMSGGALAASRYLITSTKQIKPSVLSSLKGKAGAPGKAGPAGSVGSAGPAGAGGSQGPQGPAGPKGDTGNEGAAGKEGAPGKEGSPWTAGGKLPAKKTETGTWAGVAGPFYPTFGASIAAAAISFTIPLAHAPQVKIEEPSYKGQDPECPSSAAELSAEGGAIAQAEPGFLCVYGLEGAIASDFEAGGRESPNGVVLLAAVEEKFAGDYGRGVWAVTAE